ncbi:hypothetical protein FQR65_LT15169 [Abscondita terminalis]|nr:hypothetical protein FQR65_LT15169 [Abscondita terminalis]
MLKVLIRYAKRICIHIRNVMVKSMHAKSTWRKAVWTARLSAPEETVAGLKRGDPEVSSKRFKIKEGIVPDVKGMGLIDAMYTMEEMQGLKHMYQEKENSWISCRSLSTGSESDRSSGYPATHTTPDRSIECIAAGYGVADFKAKIIESHFDGMLLNIEGHEVWVKLVGEFNAYNILAVYGAAILLEQETVKVLTALSQITGAEGRFEAITSKNGVIGIVDYAHTPDAVANVLTPFNNLRKKEQQIITVLGCGRAIADKTKRPKWRKVNARTEDPGTDYQRYGAVSFDRKKNVFSITDRREAIRAAMFILAQPGDYCSCRSKGMRNIQGHQRVENII